MSDRPSPPHRPRLASLLVVGVLLSTPACDSGGPRPHDPDSVGQQMPDVVAALAAGEPAVALQRLEALVAAGRAPQGHEHYRAVALLDDERPAEALEALQAELAARPGNGAAQLLMAEALLAMGRVAEAPAFLESAATLLPDSSYRLLVAGRVALARDDDPGAATAFEAYLRSDPHSARAAEAHHALAQVSRRAGDDQAAAFHRERSDFLESVHQYLNSFRQRLAEDPADAQAALGAGMAYLDLMRTIEPTVELARQAEAAFRHAADQDPGLVSAHLNLGFLATVAGQVDEAFAAYRRVLELDPRHVGARIDLGKLASEQHDFALAAEQLQAALAVAVEAGDRIRAHLEWGRLAERRGNDDEAVAAYRQALAIDPDHPRLDGLAAYVAELETKRPGDG